MKILRTTVVASIIITLLLVVLNISLSTERIARDNNFRKSAPGKFIRLSDGITHYKIDGPEDGEVIVMLLGATLPIWGWNSLEKELAKDGYRVISYDYYGRGYSDAPDKKYTEEFYQRQFRELIEKLIPNKKFHIVNITLGALIASEYVHQNPDRVFSMSIFCPDGFNFEAPLSTKLILNMPKPARDYIFSTFGSKILMSRLPKYSNDKTVVQKLQEQLKPELAVQGFKHSVMSTVLNMPIRDSSKLFRKLHKSKVPVQLIWGTEDYITPFPGNDKVKSLLPDSEIVLMKNIGHLPYYEDMRKTTETLTAFIKSTQHRRTTTTLPGKLLTIRMPEGACMLHAQLIHPVNKPGSSHLWLHITTMARHIGLHISRMQQKDCYPLMPEIMGQVNPGPYSQPSWKYDTHTSRQNHYPPESQRGWKQFPV